MEIYVVQKGDTVVSIAEKFGVSPGRLVLDNGLSYPHELLLGQALVITYPQEVYIVQDGDSLYSISIKFNVSIMQLLRNNPFLSERQYIFPGETLIISYKTVRKISTMGFTYPFIAKSTLLKTLPELTCVSVINYTSTAKGGIIEYRDDQELIALCKLYGTIPLMVSTTLSPTGVPNLEAANSILTTPSYQDQVIEESIAIMKKKGYGGMNFIFNYLREDNEANYLSFIQKVSKRVKEEGLLLYLSINYGEYYVDGEVEYDKINYSEFSKYVDEILFLRLKWSSYYGPPAPVANINNISKLIQYVTSQISSDKVNIGIPLIGYDWQLPYVPEQSNASSLSIDSTMNLAHEVKAEIQFDESSQTPNFEYTKFYLDQEYQHILWFVDVRSIEQVSKLIIEYQLRGKGIWNIMQYNASVWSVINSTFDVIKLI